MKKRMKDFKHRQHRSEKNVWKILTFLNNTKELYKYDINMYKKVFSKNFTLSFIKNLCKNMDNFEKHLCSHINSYFQQRRR